MSTPTLIPADIAATVALTTPPADSASVVSRSLLQTPDARVTLFSFAAGQELTSHTSRRRALVQVLSGGCDFFFGGAWRHLESGALLHLPPGHPHAVRATAGAFTMLLTLGAEPACNPSQS